MHKIRLLLYSVLLPLAVSSCSSTRIVPPRQQISLPAQPVWMMQPAPDLLTPLNEIISISESGSKQQQGR